MHITTIALPATCEPEGHLAEKSKGHIRILPGGTMARFTVRLGHLNSAEATQTERTIRSL